MINPKGVITIKVVKRSGDIAEFDKEKIKVAVLKAFIDVDKEETPYARDKAREIANYVAGLGKDMGVEEIQDVVEAKLMSSQRKDVARAYTNYRYLHSLARDQYRNLMCAVSEKISASDVANQNANVDEKSFGGRVGEASRVLMKKFALENCVSEMARNNHENNEIYIHDLDSYAVGMHNCLSVPFDDLLANGFNTRQTDVRPAQSVSTAFQLVAVIFQIQSLQQFGGVSATHIDHTMVPYVRKSFTKHLGDGLAYIERLSQYKTERFHKWLERDIDNHPDGTIHFDDVEFKNLHPDAWKYAMAMTERETRQAVEGMYHNLK